MKKFRLFYLIIPAFILISCEKSEDEDLVSPQSKGTLNGNTIDFSTTLSDVISNNGIETAYLIMRKDFEGFNIPATDGKQLLIRIEPYNGLGSYRVNSNSFWVYEEEITISGNTFSSTLHRFSSDETEGTMTVTITEDAIKQGKRTLIGKFDGKNGITIKSTQSGSQTLPLKTMDFVNVNFVAPEGEL